MAAARAVRGTGRCDATVRAGAPDPARVGGNCAQGVPRIGAIAGSGALRPCAGRRRRRRQLERAAAASMRRHGAARPFGAPPRVTPSQRGPARAKGGACAGRRHMRGFMAGCQRLPQRAATARAPRSPAARVAECGIVVPPARTARRGPGGRRAPKGRPGRRMARPPTWVHFWRSAGSLVDTAWGAPGPWRGPSEARIPRRRSWGGAPRRQISLRPRCKPAPAPRSACSPRALKMAFSKPLRLLTLEAPSGTQMPEMPVSQAQLGLFPEKGPSPTTT